MSEILCKNYQKLSRNQILGKNGNFGPTFHWVRRPGSKLNFFNSALNLDQETAKHITESETLQTLAVCVLQARCAWHSGFFFSSLTSESVLPTLPRTAFRSLDGRLDVVSANRYCNILTKGKGRLKKD